MKRPVLAAAFALAAAPAFAAGDLPDGTYACTLDGAPFGSVLVSGDQYAGPIADGAFGETSMFLVLDGKVEWLGVQPLLEVGGYRIDHSPVRPGPSGAPGFDLVMLTPDLSGFVTAACDLA